MLHKFDFDQGVYVRPTRKAMMEGELTLQYILQYTNQSYNPDAAHTAELSVQGLGCSDIHQEYELELQPMVYISFIFKYPVGASIPTTAKWNSRLWAGTSRNCMSRSAQARS